MTMNKMAFDRTEIQQLKELFGDQEIRLRSVIKEEINEIKERLDRLFAMESGDVQAAYDEIEALKKRVAALERRFASSK